MKIADQKLEPLLSQSQSSKDQRKQFSSSLNNQKNNIDFKQLLQTHNERTEYSLPYTIQQIEDTMFIDEKRLVSLEYIFYQKDGNYRQLIKDKERETDKGHNHARHELGTDDYLQGEVNPLSAFQAKPSDFHCSKKDYLEEHLMNEPPATTTNSNNQAIDLSQGNPMLRKSITKALFQNIKKNVEKTTHKTYFMETEDGKDAVVEGVVSLWKITQFGQIMKEKEVSIQYKMNFKPSKDGQMKLTLSQDKNIISLGMVNENDNKKVMMQAWYSKNLKPVTIPKLLEENLELLPDGRLDEIRYVGKSKYLLVVLKIKEKVEGKEISHLHYFIFDAVVGTKVFEFSNKFKPGSKEADKKVTRCLGMLVCEKKKKVSKKDDDDSDEVEVYGSEDDEVKDTNDSDPDTYSDSSDYDSETESDSEKSEKDSEKDEGSASKMNTDSDKENSQIDDVFDKASVRSEKPSEHSEKASEHSEKASEQSEKASEHSEKASEHSEKASERSEKASEHSEKASEHSEKASEHSEKASEHSEKASEHSDKDSEAHNSDNQGSPEGLNEDGEEHSQKEESDKAESDDNKSNDSQYSGGEEEPKIINLDLIFFYAADIKEPEEDNDKKKVKKEEKFIWTKKMIKVQTLRELGEDDLEAQYDHIISEGTKKLEEYESYEREYFEIPKSWFISSKGKEQNWEGAIYISSNCTYMKYAFLNIHKKMYLAYDNTAYSDTEMGKHYIPDLSIGSHGRNQTTKDELFLIVKVIGDGQTATCFYESESKKSIKFTKDHLYASQDVQHQKIKNTKKGEYIPFQDKVLLQSVTVTRGDQEILLKTYVTSKNSEDTSKGFETILRKTMSQKQISSFPVFVYNIGSRKLIIQNTLQNGKQMVYELPKNESFISFVEFNKFEDIGFYPNNLRIEACSNFVFLTFDKKKLGVVVNFLLIDPYYGTTQVALFQSTKVFQENVGKKYQDVIVKTFMYCTKMNEKDTDFEVRCLTQYATFFQQQSLKEDDDYSDYSYESETESYGSYDDSDDEKANQNQQIALVPMIMDKNSQIYYIISLDGQCIVKMVNPQNDLPSNHQQIYEIKSEKCNGFNISDDNQYFYFIDDYKIINKLERQKESKELVEVSELKFKDKDRPHYIKSTLFKEMIFNDRYLIQNSKIFYLQNEVPLQNGIQDMEDLSQLQDNSKDNETKKFNYGPIKSTTSSEFIIVYQYGSRMIFKIRVYKEPDSKAITLISDFHKKVELTTFLDSCDIMLKVANRYMLFDNIGKFIDEVEFSDINKELMEENKQHEKYHLENINESHSSDGGTVTYEISKKKEKEKEEPIPQSLREVDEEVKDVKKYFYWNRMHLIKMSLDNNFFLFEDRLKNKYRLYKLQNMNDKIPMFGAGNLNSLIKRSSSGKESSYEFQVVFEFDIDSIQFLNNEDLKIKTQEEKIHVMNTKVTKKVETDGSIIMMINQHKEDETLIKVYGCIIKKDSVRSFMQKVKFEDYAKTDVMKVIHKKEEILNNLIQNEKAHQKNLPKNFLDGSKIKKLQQRLEELNQKKYNVVFSEVFNGDLLLIRCGRFIQYTKMNENMFDKDINSEQVFETMDIDFGSQVEITKIWQTSINHHIQIAARDNDMKVLIIVTWDFDNNMEASMFQIKCEPNTVPENYIVKGMNQKYNYFVNEFQIYDLEYNIPLQQSTNNSLKGTGVSKNYVNQRKIYEDGTRSLSIDHANLLNFPLCRMDLLYWKNIVELGEKSSTINQNTQLHQFNQIYAGTSLFHYFAKNVDVIEMIHRKFKSAQEDNLLQKEDENMPLVILHPDPDGLTALDLAIKAERPKSFELMIDLLETFDNFSLSKMMLNSFPNMIRQGSDMIVKFFSSGIYKPVMMENAIIIPWPEDMEEYVFPCHTCLISQNMLFKEIEKFIDEDKLKSDNKSTSFLQTLGHNQEMKNRRKQMRPQILNAENKNESIVKRVSVEAIDFDWVFKGDNAKNMLMLLTQQSQGRLYIQNSIRVFIDLLWQNYQPAIVKKIFIPFIFYMSMFIFLCSSVAGEYLDTLDNFNEDSSSEKIFTVILSIVCIGFWFFFFRLEIMQFVEDPVEYFSDYWNWIDLLSSLLNFIFLVILNIDVISDQTIIPIVQIRTVGAIACFFLWTKVFYWMRLFKSTAHFITLISQTIGDVKIFSLMLLIILCAFANLFFVINNNTNNDPSYHYVDTYINQSIIDSFIAMYMVALGEFDMDGYKQGPDVYVAWAFFILATFLVLVVFMNMLIAIMGDTFSQVQAIQQESSLQEQAALIMDHIWLLDLTELFQNKRHIIRVTPDISIQQQEANISNEISLLGNTLSKKSDQVSQILMKRIEVFEKNNRSMQKSQQTNILKVKKLLNDQKVEAEKKQAELKEKEEKEKIEKQEKDNASES